MADKTFTLNNGQKIPAIGLGTWQSAAGEVERAVEHAIDAGYKLVDGAYCYGNEDEVGAGLKAAFDKGVKREDVYVTSKLWPTYATRVELAVDKSLKSLGLDYLDLYMVHWPLLSNPNGNHDKFPTLPDGERDLIREHSHVDIWKEMEKVLATGKVRSIGVSNYSKRYLEELLPHATVVPAVNQIENHPALPQQEIVDLCKEKGIHIMAYSPLGSKGGPLLTVDAVVQAAQKHNVAPSTILLSYHVARGSTVLAKSVTPDRITANLQIVDLDVDDMAAIRAYSDELTREGKLQRFVYPPWKIDFGFPDKS